MLNLNFVTSKRHFLARNRVIWAINQFSRFSCRGRQKKGRYKKSRKRYVSPIRGEAPRKRIFIKFCTAGDMPDVITCANFGSKKLTGLGYT